MFTLDAGGVFVLVDIFFDRLLIFKAWDTRFGNAKNNPRTTPVSKLPSNQKPTLRKVTSAKTRSTLTRD
jgi:hypothetical protein